MPNTNPVERSIAARLTLDVLTSVAGGQASGCPLTNNADTPAAVFPVGGGEIGGETQLAPGQPMTVPEGGFVVVMGQGAHGGTCTSGRRFGIRRNDKIDWATAPEVYRIQ